jgi:hypothetical protein
MANRCFKALLVLASCLLPGCKGRDSMSEAPPRANNTIDYPPQASTLAVPVVIKVDTLRSALEAEIPRRLYVLRKHVSRCVPPQKVKIFKARIPITPKLGCDVAIDVTREPLKLTGKGRDFVITVPIHARAKASNVAGILYETANGSAIARVLVKFSITSRWRMSGTTRLGYDWTTPPGLRLLGQRFTFTDKVDDQLRPLIARFEQSLPRELAKIPLERMVGEAWKQSFAVLELNRTNPPVWMRLTPERLMYGGYSVSSPTINLALGIEGTTETFVGDRPKPKAPIPLPPVSPLPVPAGKASLFVPVIASYPEIEPIILEALVKRSRRPFDIPHVGPVIGRFVKVDAYATGGGRVAVGLTLRVWPQASPGRAISGKVWMTAMLVNPADTRTISFRDLQVGGTTDRSTGNLLLKVINHPSISAAIATELTQNLGQDYDELRSKIDRAVGERREGDFVIRAQIDEIRSGSLRVAGQGLFLPVWAKGRTEVRYLPRR